MSCMWFKTVNDVILRFFKFKNRFYNNTILTSVSITCWYCVKKAKCRIMETTPHDSPETLVFWCQRSWQNSNAVTPTVALNAGGVDKSRWTLTYDHVIVVVVFILSFLRRTHFHLDKCIVSSVVAINICLDCTRCAKDHAFTRTCSFTGWFEHCNNG